MLLSSSNRKYPHFPLFSYFSLVVCLRCLLHHILSLIVYTFRETGNLFSLVCLYITPSHHHHSANFIWRHWTYKMPVRYNLSRVWVRLSIFSQLSIIQYVGLFFQFTHFLRDDWENIHTLSYYHHQIGSMNYYPLFRVRSWNNVMRCMSFYILSELDRHWLTPWGRDKIVVISQTRFSNAFSSIKMHEFRFRFHWGLFLNFELTIFQQWSRW